MFRRFLFVKMSNVKKLKSYKAAESHDLNVHMGKAGFKID